MTPRPRVLQLPPLNALRTFEATARHASMTNAAHELGVTQTAVSHQIRQLESFLSLKLLVRTPGSLTLTRDGQAWAVVLADVFERLHGANRRLRTSKHDRPRVSLTVLPSFSAAWLVPWLGRFYARHRRIDLQISTTEKLVDLLHDPVDLGIRYGGSRYPGLVSDKLLDDAWVVVCAPAVGQRVRRLTDLRRVPHLHDGEPDAWSYWLEHRRGGRNLRLGQGRMLSDSAQVVAAAILGHGVALARWSLAADALATGALVRPFPDAQLLPTLHAYHLVARPTTLLRPEVAAFRTWLIDEMAALAPA